MVGLITSFTLGCVSTTALPPEEPAAKAESDAAGSLFQEWQKETREQTDDLLADGVADLTSRPDVTRLTKEGQQHHGPQQPAEPGT